MAAGVNTKTQDVAVMSRSPPSTTVVINPLESNNSTATASSVHSQLYYTISGGRGT